MKNLIFFTVLFCFTVQLTGQSVQINPKYLERPWEAWWITHPEEDIFGYGVFHFRKSFELNDIPEEFIIHVSADNRYKLYVNGTFVEQGPARSDFLNWYYESVDIAGFLVAGKNTVAALVWNAGEYKPMAQISDKTAFLLQGNGEKEQVVNTGEGWKVMKDRAYAPVTYKDNDIKLNWAYYVAGALDSLNMQYYPYGWKEKDFDDGDWKEVRLLDRASPAFFSSHQKWVMTPRQVPLLERIPKRFSRIARTEGLAIPGSRQDEFIKGKANIEVPANSTVTLLVDNGILTNGYPTLVVSKGAGSRIQITYAEALYNDKFVKEHRDKVEGMHCFGVHDVVVPDGGANRSFTPLWTRPFRWIRLDITTRDEALVLEDMSHLFVASPTEIKAHFTCDNEKLNAIWDACVHTQVLSAQETFVSDLAWEQMQYVGDTKVQALTYLYMTGDEKLFRLALEQFDDSRKSTGLTQSRYPSNLNQFTPLYSLIWISMVHDYWIMGKDPDFTEQFLPGIYEVLFWFEHQINNESMIPTLPYLDFVDSRFDRRRKAISSEKENQGSTVHTLAFCIALDEAADLFEYFGQVGRASYYRHLRDRIIKAVTLLCWDEEKQLFSDSPLKKWFSQQSNILGVLSGAIPGEEQAGLLNHILEEPDILQTQMYFHFFLGRIY